ncbi:MAG: hypothetical protein K2Q27_15460, partial [Novosphingobium sp.]|nr:hypothetical protein [Novosphingobium sp.]
MTTSADTTASPQHDWLTFHRVRLRSERALTVQDAALPSHASGGRVGIDAPPDDDGMPMQRGEVWTGFAIYKSREVAEEVFADPDRHFPFCADVLEGWHALLLPFAHRGDVNWRGHVETDAAIRCGPGSAGALAVITSAGYDAESPDTAERFVAFFERVCATRQAMASHPGNLATCLVANLDERDGVTFTLWRGVDAMT